MHILDNFNQKENTMMKHTRDNIILVGMPGAGKSTIGVVLAKRLGYRFIDSDLLIQETYQMLLHQLIEKDGIDAFLEKEGEVNAGISGHKQVIATGGSAIYSANAMKHFKEIGTVIYLKLSYDSIEQRLGDLNQRGVTIKEGQTLKSLYEERIPYYERYANRCIDCENKAIRDIVAEIAEDFE